MTQTEQPETVVVLTAELSNGKMLTGPEIEALLLHAVPMDERGQGKLSGQLETTLDNLTIAMSVLCDRGAGSIHTYVLEDFEGFIEVGASGTKVMMMPRDNPMQMAAQLQLKRNPEGLVVGLGALTISVVNTLPIVPFGQPVSTPK